jgi:hypothetical protein
MFCSADTQKNPLRPVPGPTITLVGSGPTAHVSLPEDVLPALSTTIDQNALSLVSSTCMPHRVATQWVVAAASVAPFKMALGPVWGGGLLPMLLLPPHEERSTISASMTVERKNGVVSGGRVKVDLLAKVELTAN